ncbi:ferredoxin [Corynebacterium suranareeae]|uniref:Ferredoxin n=1 Tax=Corynebacterium suranareeae TaxID=2506452 RepID=A0A160PNL0_9CORY|nr:2Fe-2S iron-sulfur cluster-binding protein [Corynebacterium suranareeae]BAU94423.1 ferredoxin [Corynebacterium suranareeae]
MPNITFVFDDTEKVVEAKDGQSLMRAAVEHDIPGIIAECGGEMSCATCHVWLQGDVAQEVPQATFDEEDMLEIVDNLCDKSRLSCQVVLTPELAGLRAFVPGE